MPAITSPQARSSARPCCAFTEHDQVRQAHLRRAPAADRGRHGSARSRRKRRAEHVFDEVPATKTVARRSRPLEPCFLSPSASLGAQRVRISVDRTSPLAVERYPDERHHAMPSLSGMKGDGYYDRNSTLQNATFAAVADWIDRAVATMPLPESRAPITLVDYGCSEGGNSIVAMSRRGRWGPAAAGRSTDLRGAHRPALEQLQSALRQPARSGRSNYLQVSHGKRRPDTSRWPPRARSTSR